MIVPKDILVPIDFSDASKTALQWAVGFGQGCDASLHLLHVLESVTGVDAIAVPFAPHTQIEEAVETKAWEDLRALLPPEEHQRLRVTLAVEWGSPFAEIVRYTSSHHINLIAMGTRGHGRGHHMMLGSVAADVVRKAPCSVLAVRPDAPVGEMPRDEEVTSGMVIES
jgi:universal stress protein A